MKQKLEEIVVKAKLPPPLFDKNGFVLKEGSRVAFMADYRTIEVGKVVGLPNPRLTLPKIYPLSHNGKPYEGSRTVAFTDIAISGSYYIEVPPLEPIRIKTIKTGVVYDFDQTRSTELVIIDEDTLFANCL